MAWWQTALALVVSAVGGWGVTRLFLWLGENRAKAPMPKLAPRVHILEGEPEPIQESVLRGGLMIGMLERVALTGGLLAGYPEVIAVIVAVKGLGRFAELRSTPAAAERFIVGTLASLVTAFAVAMAALMIAGQPLRLSGR